MQCKPVGAPMHGHRRLASRANTPISTRLPANGINDSAGRVIPCGINWPTVAHLPPQPRRAPRNCLPLRPADYARARARGLAQPMPSFPGHAAMPARARRARGSTRTCTHLPTDNASTGAHTCVHARAPARQRHCAARRCAHIRRHASPCAHRRAPRTRTTQHAHANIRADTHSHV